MHFDIIPVQAIKSMSQQNLAFHWQDLHAKSGLPRFADFAPGERAHDPKQLLLWTVEERDGARDYRQLFRGDFAVQAFGAAIHPDQAPEPLRSLVKGGLDECVTASSMIYMSLASVDPSGNRIDCERLLLPFGDGDANVTHILSSLQLVSLEGTFDRRTVLAQFMQNVRVTLCGKIPPRVAAARPAAS